MDYPRDETTLADGGAGGSRMAPPLVDIEHFGSNPGNLRMRLHVPAGGGEGRPLVVALHGCTQTAAGFGAASGWMALADAHDFLLLLPEQRPANNRKTCFSWFEPHDARRGEGEVESIRQMVDATLAMHGADARRVFVTGLSAGGAMACAMAAAYPELFAGAAIVAGLPYGAASGMAQ
ncbi:MAG: PHB depolymerase family esterase, partial [Caulobacteraceae bacterium]|nr:PHB depolymerase family esterase [Caulobacter sp.]